MARSGPIPDSPELNKAKYDKVLAFLKAKFHTFNFDKIKIDYRMRPSNYVEENKHDVYCPIHGWFRINLHYMQLREFGCSECGRDSRAMKLTGIPRRSGQARKFNAMPIGYSKTMYKPTSRFLWEVPKSVLNSDRYK